MNVLKGLALGIFGILLVVSLGVFSTVFTLKSTVLNSSFIEKQVDNLDVSALVLEVLDEQSPEELPTGVHQQLENALPQLESQLDEAASQLIGDILAYLNRDASSLDLKLTLRDSLLNTEFITRVIDSLDLPALVEDFVNDEFLTDIPPKILAEISDPGLLASEIAGNLEPWLEEQVGTVLPSVLDYILGDRQTLSVIIPLGQVREVVECTIWQEVSSSMSRAEFDGYFDDYAIFLPASAEIDEQTIGSEVVTDLNNALADASDGLDEAHNHIGWFIAAYWALLGLILLCIVATILITNDFKKSSRSLGITVLVFGVVELIGTVVTANLLPDAITSNSDVPAALQSYIPNLINDVLWPVQLFALVLAAIGIALITVSIFYRRQETA